MKSMANGLAPHSIAVRAFACIRFSFLSLSTFTSTCYTQTPNEWVYRNGVANGNDFQCLRATGRSYMVYVLERSTFLSHFCRWWLLSGFRFRAFLDSKLLTLNLFRLNRNLLCADRLKWDFCIVSIQNKCAECDLQFCISIRSTNWFHCNAMIMPSNQDAIRRNNDIIETNEKHFACRSI